MEVRIERLAPLRYASAWGYGDSPEMMALERLVAWAGPKGLLDPGAGGRLFGFNNPYPTPNHPRYGYEVWLTVPPDAEPDGDIRLGEFFGGRTRSPAAGASRTSSRRGGNSARGSRRASTARPARPASKST